MRMSILAIVAGILFFALFIHKCAVEKEVKEKQAKLQPSRVIKQGTNQAGQETTVATVTEATLKQVLKEYENENSQLAKENQELKKALAGKKKVVSASVITTLHKHTVGGKTILDTSKLSVIQRQQRQGFLKPKRTVVEINQLTPGNKTIGVQSFVVPAPAPKKFGIGINVSYGIGPNLKPTPYIGIGIQRNLIRF